MGVHGTQQIRRTMKRKDGKAKYTLYSGRYQYVYDFKTIGNVKGKVIFEDRYYRRIILN